MDKKVITLILILFSSISLRAQISVGGGLVYGTEIENIGISVNGLYEVNETWKAAPTFTYFLEKNYVNWSVLDLDAHYNLTEIENIGNLYALGGLSFTFWSWDDSYNWGIPGLDLNGTEVGVNLGMGIRKNINEKLFLTPEIRYTLGDADYLRISIKIFFSLDHSK